MKYEKLNRNSDAQFMRTRVRYLHVATRYVQGPMGPLLTPGETFRAGRNAEKRRRRAKAAAFRAFLVSHADGYAVAKGKRFPDV